VDKEDVGGEEDDEEETDEGCTVFCFAWVKGTEEGGWKEGG
jgi:hypothetical protein